MARSLETRRFPLTVKLTPTFGALASSTRLWVWGWRWALRTSQCSRTAKRSSCCGRTQLDSKDPSEWLHHHIFFSEREVYIPPCEHDETAYKIQFMINNYYYLLLQCGSSLDQGSQPNSDSKRFSQVCHPATQSVEEAPIPPGLLGFLHPGQPPPVPFCSRPARYNMTHVSDSRWHGLIAAENKPRVE